MPFAQALDDLLKASNYFKGIGASWEDVEPYKSRRMKKSADTDGKQEVQDAPQQDVQAQEARWMRQIQDACLASKTSKSKSKSKPVAGKAASKTAK